MSEAITLANGLTVLLRPKAGQDVSLCLAVGAGARTDPPGKSGLAHWLEHCYALGSRTLGVRALDLMIERAGGTRGALTTPDVTLHFTTLPGPYLPALLSAEADRFETLALPEREVGYERDIVLHEGAQRIGRAPAGSLVQRLLSVAFVRHPYRNPVVGHADEVRTLGVADLRAYYSAHYVPANAALVLTGGFKPAEALERIERDFGRVPVSALPAIDCEAEPEQAGMRHETLVHEKIVSPRIAMLWKAPPLDHPDTPALLLAEGLLQLMLPQGRVRHWLLRDPGAFTFYGEGSPGAIEIEACGAIGDVAGGRIADDLFKAARQRATSRLGASVQTLARLAATSSLGADWLRGLEERQSELGPAEVSAAVAHHLRPERLSIVRTPPD